MKIAILGAGNIGGTLGKKWLAAGHEVIFGVRDSHSPKTKASLENAGGKIRAVSVEEAVRFGDVILVSVPWNAVPELVASHAEGFEHKIVLDATNNFAGPVINNIERIREKAPSAAIYRAFNSLGWEVFANPKFGSTSADMFYSGPDSAQRQVVESLIQDIGVRPIWVGDNDQVALVDGAGVLWTTLIRRGGWPRHIALKLLE
jgi:8-hydroxy-5-deazaflavin:NADPH oxidoreductase